jgi:hypothetical protein
MADPDADIRAAAFVCLRVLMLLHGGALTWAAIAEGFVVRSRRFAPC